MIKDLLPKELISEEIVEKMKSLTLRFMIDQRIAFFGYDRVYQDGSCFRLATDPKVLELLHSMKSIITPPIEEEQHSSKFIYLIPPEKNGLDERYDHFRANFKVGSVVDFIEKKGSHYDQVWMFTSQSYLELAHKLINKKELFLDFINTFKKEAVDLIKVADRSKFQLEDQMRPNFKWTEDSIKILPSINLSIREQECFAQIVVGKTAREIAQALNISVRTAEQHIENLRNKLGCAKKSEIITRGIELKLISKRETAFE